VNTSYSEIPVNVSIAIRNPADSIAIEIVHQLRGKVSYSRRYVPGRTVNDCNGRYHTFCWYRSRRFLHRRNNRVGQQESKAAVTVGLFIAALAYLEYQRILNVEWHRVQAALQNGIARVADALTHISSTYLHDSPRNTIKYWDSALH
jgi:FUN14 family